MSNQENSQNFKKSLGLLDATMLVAGSMIGSGSLSYPRISPEIRVLLPG
ncbi:hypothetical protein KUH03_31380 [Sphingobacterium sp. E70]|nr:hypothetical protein [Sphingobacterium sp. E70]ULT23634.1 hypothetical protein KUH03_31380 [Sphingobacterium sp. E70]